MTSKVDRQDLTCNRKHKLQLTASDYFSLVLPCLEEGFLKILDCKFDSFKASGFRSNTNYNAP